MPDGLFKAMHGSIVGIHERLNDECFTTICILTMTRQHLDVSS